MHLCRARQPLQQPWMTAADLASTRGSVNADASPTKSQSYWISDLAGDPKVTCIHEFVPIAAVWHYGNTIKWKMTHHQGDVVVLLLNCSNSAIAARPHLASATPL